MTKNEKAIKKMIKEYTITMATNRGLDIDIKFASGNKANKYMNKFSLKEMELNNTLIMDNKSPITLHLWPMPEDMAIADLQIKGIFKKTKLIIYTDTFMNNFLYIPTVDMENEEEWSATIRTLVISYLDRIIKTAHIVIESISYYNLDKHIMDNIILKGKWSKFIATVNLIATTGFIGENSHVMDRYGLINSIIMEGNKEE